MNMLVPFQRNHNMLLSFSFSLQNPIKRSDFDCHPARGSFRIRMGGGPRTYPGGVSKWVWKRMQAKKAKQLMKARLSRERQIYEMRKRAELKAAVSELERPWEAVERAAVAAPSLFSVGADEQVKVLADRFQRPGGFDLWSDRDGPVLFETPDELPSARFFPKGVVHSVKPYRRVHGYGLVKGHLHGELEGVADGDDLRELEDVGDGECLSSDVDNGSRFLSDDVGRSSNRGRGRGRLNYGRNGEDGDGRMRKSGNGRRFLLNNVDGSSPLNYGGDGDGRLSRSGNENGRRVLSDDDGRSSDGGRGRSSRLNYGRNGVDGDGRMRKNGNGRRFLSNNVDGSSPLTYVGDGDGILSRSGNENGRRVLFDDDGGGPSNGGGGGGRGQSSRLNYGRRNGINVDGRMRRNENGSKYVVLQEGVDRTDGGESLPRTLSSGRYGAGSDGRSRNKGSGRRVLPKSVDRSGEGGLRSKDNGRRFMSKDVDGSNGLYSRGDGSLRKQRGGYSIGGRSRGKYTNRTSPRGGRGASSEVYDMDLQQDGSYGFPKNHKELDSTGW